MNKIFENFDEFINESMYTDADIDKAIADSEAETGKKLKIPKEIKATVKELKKYKLIKYDDNKALLMQFYLSFGKDRFNSNTIKKKSPVLSDLAGGSLYGFFNDSFNSHSPEAAYISLQVIKGIEDKNNNDEPFNAYDDAKEYFKAFGLDYNRNVIFNRTIQAVSNWLKENGL